MLGAASDAVSVDCAESLTALLDACDASIHHLPDTAQQIYAALRHSSLYSKCLDLVNQVADFMGIEGAVSKI